MIPATNLYEGLNKKDWSFVLDNYLITQKMSCFAYEDMSNEQRNIIQELKRAFKRLKANGL